MRTLAIIEAKIAAERNTCLADAIISPQIDLFILDRAPQTLHENVVAHAPRPSMLILMEFLNSKPVKSALVN